MEFVDSGKNGPTGIRFALKTLLDISATSNRAPNYKAFEARTVSLRFKCMELFIRA